MNLIPVTSADGNQVYLVNFNHVIIAVPVETKEAACGCRLSMSNGMTLRVKESSVELLHLLEKHTHD